ncbi:BA75_03001T0 [Komagataella pastoris]|uniref:BA75_03001T0 n=1 Tax=Komagataella pastoris TaxID=4922 RepID=A0A1B2JD00_PICPA|nr:BA75_03001T0 [Komagataella pastoris]
MSMSLSQVPGVNGKLLRRIHRACKPTLDEPNLALNLEICDLINEKQGSLPRQAAIAVVKLVNSRDPQVSELSLSLLDNLVKNCGYPFHLQISRKEFLNELVKKFPDRPPPRYTRTQRLILGAIEEWTETICKTSRYKEDFGFIRDMHRLLGFKGYIFPEIKKEDAAVLNRSDHLKSIEELQKEERLAQSAKLQELIRRGRPQDLKEANKLMKVMSGFQEDKSFEVTKQEVAENIEKLKRKADIFGDMLNNATNVGKIDPTDETISELYGTLKSSQSTIQKLAQEESDDPEAVNTLLSLNDQVYSLLEKYNFLKEGDISNASKVKSGGGINLIDFDDDDTGSVSPVNANTNESDAVADLLSDLTFNEGSASTSVNNSNSINDLLNLGSGTIHLGSPGPQSQNQEAQSSSLPQQQSNSALDDLLNFGSAARKPTGSSAAPGALDPFGMDFPSTTNSVVSQKRFLLHESHHIKIEYEVQSVNPFHFRFFYSNVAVQPVTSFQFLVAVPKLWDLQLKPQSSNFLASNTKDAIWQDVTITSKSGDSSAKDVKIKWKIDYAVSAVTAVEDGVAVIPQSQ